MPKSFPIGKRSRKPFPLRSIMFLDEMGYYAPQMNALIQSIKSLQSTFAKKLVAPGMPQNFAGGLFSNKIISFFSHGYGKAELRREHPILRRFLTHLEARNQARYHQKDLPTLFVPKASDAFWKGQSMLYWAVFYEDWPMVEALLHAGFNPNLKEGQTLSAMDRVLQLFRYPHPTVPHSTLWLMMDKGGVIRWMETGESSFKPPAFVFQMYEEVQVKHALEQLPLSHEAHRVARRI